jgi:hypothetical protein
MGEGGSRLAVALGRSGRELGFSAIAFQEFVDLLDIEYRVQCVNSRASVA